MALLDAARGRIRYQPLTSRRVLVAVKQQHKWRVAMLEFFGTLFVLIGLAIGLLTLRLAFVLIHGALH